MATRKNFPDRKEKRQAEAKVRQDKSNKLTVEQKLAKATPGSQEFVRLQAKAQK